MTNATPIFMAARPPTWRTLSDTFVISSICAPSFVAVMWYRGFSLATPMPSLSVPRASSIEGMSKYALRQPFLVLQKPTLIGVNLGLAVAEPSRLPNHRLKCRSRLSSIAGFCSGTPYCVEHINDLLYNSLRRTCHQRRLEYQCWNAQYWSQIWLLASSLMHMYFRTANYCFPSFAGLIPACKALQGNRVRARRTCRACNVSRALK